jgi:aspartyl-tRNA(Asn)/glutamyl-tRNA(Gln) amidotransferase subunit A
MFAEAASWHKDIFSKHHDVYAPSVRDRIEQGQKISAVEYIRALKEREYIIDEWEKACREVDVIVAPTEPITAYKIGLTRIMTRGKEEDARPMCILHTRLANMTGGPALSVPCGLTQEGLPVGLMIMGGNLEDVTVLKVGHVYEKFNPFTFPVNQ